MNGALQRASKQINMYMETWQYMLSQQGNKQKIINYKINSIEETGYSYGKK